MGEAQNPGPKGQNRPGNRAPGMRINQAETQARWHGTRAASHAPAGERTKGNRPGPKPSDNRIGNRPGGSVGEVSNSAIMRTNKPSRAGSAQRKQTFNYPKQGKERRQ
jgi:hypothetical protein